MHKFHCSREMRYKFSYEAFNALLLALYVRLEPWQQNVCFRMAYNNMIKQRLCKIFVLFSQKKKIVSGSENFVCKIFPK